MKNNLTLTLRPRDLAQLDQAVMEHRGMDLRALVAEKPRDAYRVCEAYSKLVAGSATSVKANNKDIVSAAMDGSAATAGMATSMIADALPDIDITPIEVVIQVTHPVGFIDFLRGKSNRTEVIISFQVEPPSLAG